jgi:hypothetical protein
VLVRTDDEVYRVDAVWLGPPRATFPWRARYVSYGLGLLIMIFVMFVQRRVGIGLDFFSVAWALILTVLITRFIGHRIDYERPFGQVVGLFRAELTGPRARTAGAGGEVRSAHVRIGSPVRPTKRAERRLAREAQKAQKSRAQKAGAQRVAAPRATDPARAAHARTSRPVPALPARALSTPPPATPPPAAPPLPTSPLPTRTSRRQAGHRERRARGQA